MAGRSNTEAEALPSEAAQKVGSRAGAICNAPVSSLRPFERRIQISRTPLSCRLRAKSARQHTDLQGGIAWAPPPGHRRSRVHRTGATPGGPTCLTVSLPCPYSRGGRTVLSGYTRCYDFSPHWVPLALMSESTRGGRGHPAARDVRDGSDPRAPAGVRPNPRHSAARRIPSAVSTGRHATISAKTSSRSTPPRSSTSDSTTSLATMAPAALDRSRRLGPDRTEGAPAPFTR